MKISHGLKMKIISSYEGINIEQHYNEVYIAGSIPIKVPLYKEISLLINLDGDLNLIKECARWYKRAFDKCLTPIDIGPFIGLFPTEINMNNNTVTFVADEYNPNNQNWKDWFVMEEN